MIYPSNFSASLLISFLGSKDPTPPAIIIFGAENSLLLFVLTIQFSLSCLTSSTLSLKKNSVLKGLICSNNFLLIPHLCTQELLEYHKLVYRDKVRYIVLLLYLNYL